MSLRHAGQENKKNDHHGGIAKWYSLNSVLETCREQNKEICEMASGLMT